MSLEVLENLKRKVTFTVKKDDVQALVKTELQKYAKDAKAPGFRPGKVPSQIVEQAYGGKAYEDALNNQINKEFVDAITKHKIDMAGAPQFNLENAEDAEAKEFVFSAIFEVMPEVAFADFAKIEIEKPDCKFDASIIAITIDSLRKQKASYTSVDRKAESGDKVTISFVGTVDDEEFEGGTATDYQFTLGEGRMLPEFEAGILGLSIGQTKSVEVNFPEEYHADNLKGKLAVFDITLNKVEESILPKLDAEFIRSIGVPDGSIETLNKEITVNMKRELKRRLRAKTRENILAAFSEANPFDVPSQLVHDEIHHMMDTATENMKKQGYPEDKINLTHEMFEHDAKRFVRLRLLVQQFIKENNISVNAGEIKAIVTDMAELYEDPAEYVSWYYSDKGRVSNARAIAIENKVLESIMQMAKCKEVTVSYEDLMKLPL